MTIPPISDPYADPYAIDHDAVQVAGFMTHFSAYEHLAYPADYVIAARINGHLKPHRLRVKKPEENPQPAAYTLETDEGERIGVCNIYTMGHAMGLRGWVTAIDMARILATSTDHVIFDCEKRNWPMRINMKKEFIVYVPNPEEGNPWTP